VGGEKGRPSEGVGISCNVITKKRKKKANREEDATRYFLSKWFSRWTHPAENRALGRRGESYEIYRWEVTLEERGKAQGGAKRAFQKKRMHNPMQGNRSNLRATAKESKKRF